jgi:hypothetical protein
MNRTQKALKEMMEMYEVNRQKWLEQFGTEEGFNEWFTQSIPELPQGELELLLEKHDCKFQYDRVCKVWCLYGIDNGNGWETEDYPAESLEEAREQAVDYLIAFNES